MNHGNLSREHEDLKRKWQESSEVTRRIPEYEQKIAHILKENEKMQVALSSKTEEVNDASSRHRQTQGELETLRRQVADYEGEVKSRVNNY
mgnify:CR=1 FL=1